MPKFNDTLELANNKIPGSNFGFSSVKLDKLGASEYTLVSIAIDISGSIL